MLSGMLSLNTSDHIQAKRERWEAHQFCCREATKIGRGPREMEDKRDSKSVEGVGP